MAKRTTWTRHAPDGGEVPLESRDRGLFRHGTTTYSGSDSARLRAWVRDMRGQTGLGLLAAVEGAACAILRAEGHKVPRDPTLAALGTRRGIPGYRDRIGLLDATASPVQTTAYFAARALEAAILARGEIEAGRAENAVYWAIKATSRLEAAQMRRHLELDALRGRRSHAGSKKSRPRPGSAEQTAEYWRLREKGMGDRAAGAQVARRLGGDAATVRRNAETIRRRARRNKKVGT